MANTDFVMVACLPRVRLMSSWQVQGEVAKTVDGAPKRSAMWIIRNLGLVGLYKGASACLLRDVSEVTW